MALRVQGLLALGFAVSAIAAPVPNVPLKNAAKAGVVMPAVGLGTFGYATVPTKGDCQAYPECWYETGCGPAVQNATATYITMASAPGVSRPVRLDSANDYINLPFVAAAIHAAAIPRSDIFLLSKIGNAFAMGYDDTLAQVASILSTMNETYVDALLIHWPTSSSPSKDPQCNAGKDYNATACRLSTWKGMVEVFNKGQALSIGVSNYNVTHLQEILDAGMPLPAINQIPVHIYRSSSQADTIAWCNAHGVLVNAYMPLGVPDWHTFPTSNGMSPLTLNDPVLGQVAAAHQRSPAEVTLAWLWAQGIVTNPRTYSPAHMAENLGAYDITLTPAEIASLSGRPQDWCSVDPTMYTCAPTQ